MPDNVYSTDEVDVLLARRCREAEARRDRPVVVLHRDFLVRADWLLSLVISRGAAAVDADWRANATELVVKLRAATPA